MRHLILLRLKNQTPRCCTSAAMMPYHDGGHSCEEGGGDGGAWPSLQHKSRKQWQFGQLSVLLSAC
jgi:hypothetical protein